MPGVLERLRLLRRASRPVEPALPDVARSIAIIMDGNARWARSRGLPVLAGHSAGTRALRRTVEACLDVGVDSLAVFAFSTENWNRPDDEVRGLLDLLAETIRREFPDMGPPPAGGGGGSPARRGGRPGGGPPGGAGGGVGVRSGGGPAGAPPPPPPRVGAPGRAAPATGGWRLGFSSDGGAPPALGGGA